MAKTKKETKKKTSITETILYKSFFIFYLIGSIPYKLPIFIASVIVFFINLFFLLVSSIVAIVLLAGIVTLVVTKYMIKQALHGVKDSYLKAKKGFVTTGKTAYKYKLPLLTPILFFTILYLVMTFIGNVKSQEKKVDHLPENVKIYDNTHKVLYNGTLDHIEEVRYIREREFVEEIITELRTDPNFNILNKDNIVVYTDGATIKHIYTADGNHIYGSRFDLFFNK